MISLNRSGVGSANVPLCAFQDGPNDYDGAETNVASPGTFRGGFLPHFCPLHFGSLIEFNVCWFRRFVCAHVFLQFLQLLPYVTPILTFSREVCKYVYVKVAFDNSRIQAVS